MIFKTITSSVDESRQTLALFNKDWATYKRNWQNANGIGGKIGSLFTPANAITKTDIDAIKAYNAQIDSCVTSQTAFNRTMLNASPAAQNLVASYNGGKVSAQGMATAQNMAKTSTIGLTIAQTALNVAIGMGIGLLINLVVQGVNKLVHANEEAIESAKKLREEYEEFKSTNASNVSTLKGLEEEFKELSKGVSQYGDNISLTTEQYERYKEIIQQIVGMSPSLAEGYSTENGYIADKNGLLERAIELQEIEYRNELRKITNLENLKTSMSGYIAEYKDALNGGVITDEGNIVGTTIDTDFKNSLWQLFNTNNRENYDGQSMAKDIMESLGIKDIDAEMQKYFNEYGYWQDSWFWNDYCDTIINNLNAVTDSLSFEEVGLDEEVFDQNLEKLESYAESYRDMKDSVEMANNAIQTDLGYIAEYADGYSKLSTEQQKFVTDFLKGFNISDITSENAFGFLEYDNDKMASVKSQIKKFVEELSQDESTKEALADLYAIPTDEQSISEFVEQFRSALEIIKIYCEENGIEIPIAITNSEETINELEAQQQRAVDFAKDKFDGYDPTAFFKENSINTKEEVDKWLEIAQAANSATEAEKKYIEGSTSSEADNIFSYDKLSDIPQKLSEVENAYKTAQEALDSYNEKGYYSLDVIDSILSLEDEYINVLVDQNGQLQINESSMNQLAKIKIEAAKASIYQETCEELVRIKTLDTSLAAQELALVNGTLTESAYETAKALYEEVVAMGGANAALANNVWDSATKKVKLLDNQLKSLNSGSYDIGKSAISDSAKKATKDAEKATKEYIDSYMNYMEQSLKTGRIDYQTYSRDVAKFLKDMYDQGKIAAKDYHDYTKQMLEMEKSIYDAALSAINDLLDDEIDKIEDSIDVVEKQNDALEEQKTLMENAASAVVDYIDSLIDGENEAIDALNKANDGIQEQIDKYDSLVNVADRLYESEQNRLKDEQDAIQEKIDLLQEENDQKDLQYRKEQALYELQRSQEQRTKKVYVGGDKGYVYDTDKSAISDAKKNLQDIETEELISSLEKEKDALQGSIDALQEYRDTLSDISDAYQELVDERNAIELIGENYEDVILGMNINDWILLKDKYIFANNEMADNENIIKSHDEKIKIWEEEKRKWGNLSSVIDTESKKQAAIQKFGADWQEKINNNRLISFDEFKEQYLNIDSQINDNNTLINSYNEKIRYYESLKKQWSSITSVYEDEMNKQYAAQLLGLNWESDVLNGRLGTLDNFKNQYISIQQQIADAAWKSANEQIRAAQEAAKGAGGSIDANSRFNITYGDLSGFKQKLNDVKKYGASAVIAPKINNNTQNTNNNTGILDKYYKKLKRGSKYASGTKNAKKGLNLVGEDGVETYIDNNGNVSLVTEPTLIPMEGGEIVKNESETKSLLDSMNLVPIQTGDIWKKFAGNMPDLSNMVKFDVPDYSKISGMASKAQTIEQHNQFNVTLPNITDSTKATKLFEELQRLPLDALQYANIRKK